MYLGQCRQGSYYTIFTRESSMLATKCSSVLECPSISSRSLPSWIVIHIQDRPKYPHPSGFWSRADWCSGFVETELAALGSGPGPATGQRSHMPRLRAALSSGGNGVGIVLNWCDGGGSALRGLAAVRAEPLEEASLTDFSQGGLGGLSQLVRTGA